MKAEQIKQLIGDEKLVPILRTYSKEHMLGLAQGVTDAGGKIIEYTMTIRGVVQEIAKVREKFPDLIIGLGTVYDKKDAAEAIANGADFINTPIMNLDIVDTVKAHDKLIMLSGFTPTEIYNAHKAGADIIKLFPASEMNPTFIREIKGPMPFVDIFPTGGLDLITGIQFLSFGAFAVGMGSTIFKKTLIESRDYVEITRLLKNVLYRIKRMEL